MLQHTVRERSIKTFGPEWQKSRIRDDALKRQTHTFRDPFRSQHRPKTGVDAYRKVTFFRSGNGPPAPAAPDIEQRFAFAVWKPNLWNGIIVQETDEMLVENTVGRGHQLRHDGIDNVAARSGHVDAVFLLLRYAEGIAEPGVGIPSLDIRRGLS